MKNFFVLTALMLLTMLYNGCGRKGSPKQAVVTPADTQTVADTGFTGIRQYFSQKTLSYQVTFKNGVKQGLMKTFYPGGKTRVTFWYENGLRQDTAVWFFEEGGIFRKTPFKNDSINGTQIQYYRNGRIRAKMSFVDGLRTGDLEEYHDNGNKITDYPAVVIKTKDNYTVNGTFNIYLSLNKPDIKVNFYRGDFINGLFNPKIVKKINSSDFTGFLQLGKSTSPGISSAEIIAEISTTLGNKYLVRKSVPLPYKDLK